MNETDITYHTGQLDACEMRAHQQDMTIYAGYSLQV